MAGDLQARHEQENDRIRQFELEAKEGDSNEFFQDLQFRIDLCARGWVFFHMSGKITVEEHEVLIYRKFDLIKTIKECGRKKGLSPDEWNR
jgi:hypothetical protein